MQTATDDAQQSVFEDSATKPSVIPRHASTERSKRARPGSSRGRPARATGAAISRETRRWRATSSCCARSSAATRRRDGSRHRRCAPDPETERFAIRLREQARPDGGWSSLRRRAGNLSVSCLAYFALKIAGDSAHAPHMRARARSDPGAGRRGAANSYTRYHLAMFGQCGWDDVPAIPPEIMFLPGRRPVQRLRHVELVAHDLRAALDHLRAPSGRLASADRGVVELFATRADVPRDRARAAARDRSAALEHSSSAASIARSRSRERCRSRPAAPARRRARRELDDRRGSRTPTAWARSCRR